MCNVPSLLLIEDYAKFTVSLTS